MRILGHIHTLNDEDVIERSLRALREQTYPLAGIVVVDNGSSDGTLERIAGEPVHVIRHSENLGTSGSVVSGIRYGLEQDFDWIWLFDADTAAQKDALEKLVGLYEGLSEERQREIWLLSSLHVERGRTPHYQADFTPDGFRTVRASPGDPVCEFDSTIWSGALYRLEVVREIGVPSEDYVLDWGEHEYGYRGRRHGYHALLEPSSLVEHNIGDEGPALHHSTYRLGPISIRMRELPPIRCYYLVRNIAHFWLFEYQERSLRGLIEALLRMCKLTASFALRGPARWPQTRACLMGWRDALRRRMSARYVSA